MSAAGDAGWRSELAGGEEPGLSSETVTYRGRSLEEVLPKIREELGPDAIIERQRTGLVGGVGGFFQREMVEVDARPAVLEPDLGRFDAMAGDEDDEAALRRAVLGGPLQWEDEEDELLPEDDGAGAQDRRDEREGLEAPAMRQIVEQASPFAELLAGATAMTPPGTGGTVPTVPPETGGTVPTVPPPDPEPDPHPGAVPDGTGGTVPAVPRVLPPAAAGHEGRLVERGLSPQVAASVVAETLAHALPFAPSRHLKRTVRSTLARRIPVQAGLGGGGRVIALVGAAGAGKTRTAAGLAAGYAAGSDVPVACLALRPRDGSAELAELLVPHGVTVQPGRDGATLRGLLAERPADTVAILDTPAVSPRDPDAIAALAADLAAAGVTEAHVVLPATVAAPVAREALEAYAPVRPAALLLTHADETDHLGPLIDLAIDVRIPLSFVVAGADVGEGLTLADPAALATRLLP